MIGQREEPEGPSRLDVAERNDDSNVAIRVGALRELEERVAVRERVRDAPASTDAAVAAAVPHASAGAAAALSDSAQRAERGARRRIHQRRPRRDARFGDLHVELRVHDLVLGHRARVGRAALHDALERIAHVVAVAERPFGPGERSSKPRGSC